MKNRRNLLSCFIKFPAVGLMLGLCFALNSLVKANDPSGKMDFDGDGKTDIAVYRAGQRGDFSLPPSYFYILGSRDNLMTSYQWGRAYDIHTPADYDGDGKTDVGIFRWIDNDLTPTASHFWIGYSSGGHSATHFSGFGNIISRNYFNDAKAEIAVFDKYNVSEDPTNPCFIWAFYIKTEGTPFPFQKDITNNCLPPQTYLTPAVADYNGDGYSDLAVFENNSTNPAATRIKIWHSPVQSLYTEPEIVFPFDIDYPIPGDYDGDGIADIAGSKNIGGVRFWRIRKSTNGAVFEMYFGFSSDYAVPGDYDGDGRTDIGVYRPSNGTWYIIRSSDNGLTQARFGAANDIPVTMPNSNIYY